MNLIHEKVLLSAKLFKRQMKSLADSNSCVYCFVCDFRWRMLSWEVGSDRTAYEKAMLLFLSTSLLCPYCLGNVTVPFLLLSTPTWKSNICCGSLVVVDVADAAAPSSPNIPPMVFLAALSFAEITGSFDSFTNCLYNPLPYISMR